MWVFGTLYASITGFCVVTCVWSWTFWSYPSTLQLEVGSFYSNLFLALGYFGPFFGGLAAWDLSHKWPVWQSLFARPRLLSFGALVFFLPVLSICSSLLLFNAIVQHEEVNYSLVTLLKGLYRIPLGALNPTSLLPAVLEELGWRGFLFTQLTYEERARGPRGRPVRIRNSLISALVSGVAYWLWHIPLAHQRWLWRVCDGKRTLFLTIYPIFCLGMNTFLCACYQISGLSVILPSLCHSVIIVSFKFVQQELPLLDEEVVLWAMTLAVGLLGLVLAAPLYRGDMLMTLPMVRQRPQKARQPSRSSEMIEPTCVEEGIIGVAQRIVTPVVPSKQTV